MDQAIESQNDGIIGVKPSFQDALTDSFRESMSIIEKSIDSKKDKGLTGKEYAQVYLGSVNAALSTAADLSKEEAFFEVNKQIREAQRDQIIAETKSKEIENYIKNSLDARIKTEQIKQLQAETYFKNIQAEQIIQSVYDNRLIKIIDSLSDMVGMILNGGTQSVPTTLLDTLVATVNIVKAIPKLSYPTIMVDAPIDLYDVSEVGGVKTYALKTNVLITGSVRDVAAGESISVQVNGMVYNTTVTADLVWSVTISGSVLDADADRTLYAIVSASDTQGNVRVSMDAVSYMEKPS